ncbi:MAG: hypothetical protein P8O19_05685 [Woeseiaceae bacterium]|nr:hypothetical protein [Woeseiaceae bacterium]
MHKRISSNHSESCFAHTNIRVFDRDTNPYELRCLDCCCHIKWASKKEYEEHLPIKMSYQA